MPMPATDVWSLIDFGADSQCWPWRGRIDESGYGRIGKRSIPAHRFVFEALRGPIPPGMETDHLCHTHDRSCRGGVSCRHRLCVNPNHLEIVTHKVNALRGRSFAASNARKTHCPQGHPYDEANTIVYVQPSRGGASGRYCRACRRKVA